MLVRLFAYAIVLAIIFDAVGFYELEPADLEKYQVAALALIAAALAGRNGFGGKKTVVRNYFGGGKGEKE